MNAKKYNDSLISLAFMISTGNDTFTTLYQPTPLVLTVIPIVSILLVAQTGKSMGYQTHLIFKWPLTFKNRTFGHFELFLGRYSNYYLKTSSNLSNFESVLKGPLHERRQSGVTAKCCGHRQSMQLSLQDRSNPIVRYIMPCRPCSGPLNACHFDLTIRKLEHSTT